MNQTGKWSLVALAAAVAVLAAGWFLLVSPKRGEAADLRTQDQSAQAGNAQLRSKLAELKALAPELPKKQAEFAAIRKQIPDNPALPDLVRQLTAATKKSGVDLTTMSPGAPQVLVSSVPTAPVAAPAGSTSAGTPAAAPAVGADQLYQVPLALTVTGSYTELSDFVDRLENLRRVMLVKGFTLGSAPTANGAAGATAGALSMTLNGQVYMVHSVPAVATPVAAGSAAPGGTTSTTGTATTGTPATAGASN